LPLLGHSWHRSIGRDTFWTAPHMIYACGVLADISSAYLILTTTFHKSSPLRDVSVRIWGFTGPIGAFLSAWGGTAMLVSAPFDDWWHNGAVLQRSRAWHRLTASDLGHPPAQPDEQESPVVEELGRLTLEGVADELQDPAEHEEAERDRPEARDEQRRDEQHDRENDERDAERVAQAIDRMPMAARVLRDPVVPRTSTQHFPNSTASARRTTDRMTYCSRAGGQ